MIVVVMDFTKKQSGLKDDLPCDFAESGVQAESSMVKAFFDINLRRFIFLDIQCKTSW